MLLKRLMCGFFVIVVALLMICATSFAADLSITIDKNKNLATVNNSLKEPVTLLFLMAPSGQRLPLFSKLPPGGSAQVLLRFAMPDVISYAVCEIFSKNFERKKAADNYYHLSVEIL